MNKAIRIALIFILLTILFAAVYIYTLMPSKKPNPVALNPIPLETTAENGGKRCKSNKDEPNFYNEHCLQLQQQLKDAIKANDLGKAREAIRLGADVNGFFSADTPMRYSAKYGKREMILLLLENGARLDDYLNPLLLKIAIIDFNHEALETFLENGADVCKTHTVAFGASSTMLDTAKKADNKQAETILNQYGARLCRSQYLPF